MSRILNSDSWANGLPIALLVAMILAISLSGCAAMRNANDPSSWWQDKERWRSGAP